MRALMERAEALARAAQKRRIEHLSEEWRERAPGATVTTSSSALVIAARGLRRRWITDPLLRFAGQVR